MLIRSFKFAPGLLAAALYILSPVSHCALGQDLPKTPAASELRGNMDKQIAAGNDQGALVVGNTLVTKYPDSPEAKGARIKIQEIQAKQAAQREAATVKDRADQASAALKDKADFKRLLGVMSRHEDRVEHDTFYTHRGFSRYEGGHRTYINLYIGQHASGSVWLRSRLEYAGHTWIFFETIKINVDGQTISDKELGFFHVQRDNDSDGVREWVDLSVDDNALPIFDSLAAGKVDIVRFDGKFRYDLEVPADGKSAMRDTLRLYRLMKSGMRLPAGKA